MGTRKGTPSRKSAFDISFNAFSLRRPQIWPEINGFASREQKLKNNRFLRKTFFSIITFHSVKAQHSFCQQRIPPVGTRRMNYNLTLKGHLEQVKLVAPDRKRSCCISVDPYRWPEPMVFCGCWGLTPRLLNTAYGVFIALAGLYQMWLPKKLVVVTFHDLKWPWRHEEGSLVVIFRLRVSSLPLTRCLRVFWMVFLQKSRLSFFSHWLIMER